MEALVFRVDVEPMGQPRPHEGVSKKGFVYRFVPVKHPIHAYRQTIQAAAKMLYRHPPMTGPLKIDIVAVYHRRNGRRWKTKPMPREWKSTKPDNDNVEKAIWDALKGVLWIDDAQIADSRCRKFEASGCEPPHLVIRVEPLIVEVAEATVEQKLFE